VHVLGTISLDGILKKSFYTPDEKLNAAHAQTPDFSSQATRPELL
jgi:hypothetical protein